MISPHHVSHPFLLLLLLRVLSTVAQSSLVCGTIGYHDEVNVSNYMGNFFYRGLTSFTLCAAYCKKDPRCEYFRYSYYSDADSQYCEFFNIDMSVLQSPDVSGANIYSTANFTVDSTSPFYYYDVGCAFPLFEEPVTVTSISTLAAITVTSTQLATIISTLPAVTKTSTVAGAAVITTQTTTQTLPAQTRTVTAPVYLTTTLTAVQNVTPQTSTVYYPVTTTISGLARTITASYMSTATAYVYVTSTRTLPAQTSTVYYAVTSTATSTAVYYLTATLTATITAQAQATQAPSPPPPQTITRISTRTYLSTTTDVRYLRTVTATRRVC